jgi:hypothetical protein
MNLRRGIGVLAAGLPSAKPTTSQLAFDGLVERRLRRSPLKNPGGVRPYLEPTD